MGLGNPPKPPGWWPCCAKPGSKWLKFESLVARHLESVFGRSCSTQRRAKLMSGRKCCCTWPVVLNWSRRASDRPWSAACVVADRFVSSTLAYQGAAGGLDQTAIRDAARAACGEVTPDLVAIFDVDESTAAGRMGLLRDRMEARGSAYHAAVRRGYHEQAESEPETHVLIDAARSLDHVFADFLGVLGARFGSPDVQSNSSPRNVEAK